MKIKRIAFGFLISALMACNFITQMIVPPMATPLPTATLTPTAILTPSPTPTPLVPVYIPPQCANSALATIAPDTALAQSALDSKRNPDISKSMQLQVLRNVANLVEDVYVYRDFNGKDWKAIEEQYRSKVEAGLETEAFYQEMKLMIFELEDEHSNFLSPIEVEADVAELKGEVDYVGVGVYGSYDFEKDSFVVISTFPGSSAEYGGLQSHDSIIMVDGLPITEELGNRLRGPECSVVLAKVQSPGEAPRDVMLMRYHIEGSIPVDARLVSTTDGSKIGYIFIPTFFDETIPPQVEEALNGFGPLDGLIVDLRMNGGGSSTVTYPILEFFV